MTAYEVVLFVHIMVVIGAFATSGVLHVAMVRMRLARTAGEVALWAGVSKRGGRLMPPWTLGLFGSGAYLVEEGWAWGAGWVIASVAGLAALTLLGATSGARFGRALDPALRDAPLDEPPGPRLAAAVRAPGPWVGSHATTAVALAIVWLMVMKPGAPGSAAALTAAAAAGALSALPFCRPAPSPGAVPERAAAAPGGPPGA